MMKRTLYIVLAVATLVLAPTRVNAQHATGSDIATLARAALNALPGTILVVESGALPSVREPVIAAASEVTDVSRNDETRSSLLALATAVTARSGASAEALVDTWLGTSSARRRVVLVALTQVGTPYRWGGTTPDGFDCSGFTSYAWASVGVRLPRVSTDQIAAALPRTVENVRPGDLLWRPGHIGMAIGVADLMVNATQTGRPVDVTRWGKVSRIGSPVAD